MKQTITFIVFLLLFGCAKSVGYRNISSLTEFQSLNTTQQSDIDKFYKVFELAIANEKSNDKAQTFGSYLTCIKNKNKLDKNFLKLFEEKIEPDLRKQLNEKFTKEQFNKFTLNAIEGSRVTLLFDNCGRIL